MQTVDIGCFSSYGIGIPYKWALEGFLIEEQTFADPRPLAV